MEDIKNQTKRTKDKRGNGEGHFMQLPDGRYRLVWMHGFNANGKPRRLTVTAPTKSQCIRLKNERERKIPKKSLLLSDGMSLVQLCRLHLKDDIKKKHKLKPTSADRRETTIENQIAGYDIGAKQAIAVSPREIDQHIETLIAKGYSISTVTKTFNVLNAAYKWGILYDLLDKNPCEKVKGTIMARLKKLKEKDIYEPDVVVLTEAEQKILLKEALRKNEQGMYVNAVGPSVAVLLYTGLRLGEWCALRQGDYQLIDDVPYLSVSKTRHYQKDRTDNNTKYQVEEGPNKNDHARFIQLDDNAQKLLDELINTSKDGSDDAYLYLNKAGNPSNPSNMGTLINKLYRKAGLPNEITGAHVLRRTFATTLFQNGINVNTIASYIGDQEATVSQYYIAKRKKLRKDGKSYNYVPFPNNRTINNSKDDKINAEKNTEEEQDKN